jgi:predicted enzyme related to lactoylglutathione lyase
MAEWTWARGLFCWRELMTDDVEAARRFYADLLGWTWKGDAMPTGTYWVAASGGREVAGVLQRMPDRPGPSAWSSYVLVDSVDAAVARAREAGGAVLREPMDIPTVGRFAVLKDPWGAVFQPFTAAVDEAPPPGGMPPPGAFCWETLVAPDVAAATAYYTRVVGFGTGRTPNGEGVVLTAGGQAVADLQPARPGGPSYWATYVAVADAVASRDRAAALGGRVLVPRIDVPQVGSVAIIADPGGAALGLFQAGAGR